MLQFVPVTRKRKYWPFEPTPDDETVMAELHGLTGIVARNEIIRLALRWLRDHLMAGKAKTSDGDSDPVPPA